MSLHLNVNLADGARVGGRVRAYTWEITLDSQTPGVIPLGRVNAGQWFVGGKLTSTVSLGSATVAIGTAAIPGRQVGVPSLPANPGKYRTAATFTAVNTPTAFGNVAAMQAVSSGGQGPAEAYTGVYEELTLTTAVANLPASGTLVVTLEYSGT